MVINILFFKLLLSECNESLENDGTLYMKITKFVDYKLANMDEEFLDDLVNYYGGILSLVDYYINHYESQFIVNINTSIREMKIICLTPRLINELYTICTTETT